MFTVNDRTHTHTQASEQEHLPLKNSRTKVLAGLCAVYSVWCWCWCCYHFPFSPIVSIIYLYTHAHTQSFTYSHYLLLHILTVVLCLLCYYYCCARQSYDSESVALPYTFSRWLVCASVCMCFFLFSVQTPTSITNCRVFQLDSVFTIFDVLFSGCLPCDPYTVIG